MARTEDDIANVVNGFRVEIAGSQRAALATDVSGLEEHTRCLEQLVSEGAHLLRRTRPSASQELIDLRRELCVYSAVLTRLSRSIQAEMNVLSLCTPDSIYGPDGSALSVRFLRR